MQYVYVSTQYVYVSVGSIFMKLSTEGMLVQACREGSIFRLMQARYCWHVYVIEGLCELRLT